MTNVSAFRADRPIRSAPEDLLDVEPFVRRLVGPLLHAPADGSLVIGLYGPWGHGKSSALNLLQLALLETTRYEGQAAKETPEAVVVRFTPWLYASVETLLPAFFETLAASVGSSKSLKPSERVRWKQSLRTMAKFAAPALKLGALVLAGPAGAAAADAASRAAEHALKLANAAADAVTGAAEGAAEMFTGGEASFHAQRDEAASVLRALAEQGRPLRVVVLIDDLDRAAGADEVLAVLKLVKLVADLPNVSYVVAMDHERVRDILRQAVSPRFGDTFLEKIIQIPLSLPPLDSRRISQLVVEEAITLAEKANIDEASLRVDWNSWEILRSQSYERPLRGALRNLRDAARVLNAFQFAILTGERHANVHAADLLLLCTLQALFPSVYDAVRHNRRFLLHEDFDDSRSRSSNATDSEQARLHRRSRLYDIAGVTTTSTTSHDGSKGASETPRFALNVAALEIIEFLFPYAVSGLTQTDVRERKIDRDQGRLRSPERFDGFFRLERPRHEVSRSDVDAVFGALTQTLGAPHAPNTERVRTTSSDASTTSAADAIMLRLSTQLAQLSKEERESLYSQLDDRSAGITPEQAHLMSRSLPLLARSASENGVSSQVVRGLASHVLRTLTLYDPEKPEESRTQDIAAVRQMLMALVETLPAADAADYAGDLSKLSDLQSTLGHDVVKELVRKGLDRSAELFASTPNVFESQEAIRGWELVWTWRRLAHLAGAAPVDSPYPPLEDYLSKLLSGDPSTLGDILALAAGWGRTPSFRHRTTDEIRRLLSDVMDFSTLEDKARATLESGTDVHWPGLVKDFVARLDTDKRELHAADDTPDAAFHSADDSLPTAVPSNPGDANMSTAELKGADAASSVGGDKMSNVAPRRTRGAQRHRRTE